MRDQCGARTRAGAPCRAPKVAGKTRCRMHGGAAEGKTVQNDSRVKLNCTHLTSMGLRIAGSLKRERSPIIRNFAAKVAARAILNRSPLYLLSGVRPSVHRA